MFRYLSIALCCACAAWAQTRIMPLSDVRAGMKGTGKTVFSGDKIEDFGVEILGVLENSGPKQALILARLTGSTVERTGVMQGMSGSPVYIQGRLVGAVSSAFPFAKEPIAGIQPIEQMLAIPDTPPAPAAVQRAAHGLSSPSSILPRNTRAEMKFGDTSLVELSAPLSLSGFTQHAIDQFAPQFRALGWEPRQGSSSGGTGGAMGDPARIKAGSMISVQLMRGDLAMGADGTVTHVDGNRIFAFGHRFLSAGGTELPFARSEVLTLLPNLSTSFKVSTAREQMGVITRDASVGVTGTLGKPARMVPLEASVEGPGGRRTYRVELVRDRLLTPFLAQVASFAMLDATERLSGAATIEVKSQVEFDGHVAPLKIDNVYSADTAAGLLASLATALPLTYAVQSDFDELTPRTIKVHMRATERKQQWTVAGIWASPLKVRPGGSVKLTALLRGPAGEDVSREFTWAVPSGMQAGAAQVLLSDATTANLSEFASAIGQQQSTAEGTVEFLNSLRANQKAYLRVLLAKPGFTLNGRPMTAPPSSIALLFKDWQSSIGANAMLQSSAAEFSFEPGTGAVTGSKSIPIEIQE
ncbi:MAG: SpoIVB peptidase S55 domain-containing protein [Acidobacteriota bacterium]